MVVIFYDFEVFAEDWLVVIVDMGKKEEHIIINDKEKLEKVYQDNINNIWVGYNNVHYDQFIMRAILLDMNPKTVNEYIITKGNSGWLYSSLFKKIKMINYDVMLGNDKGLKLLEGFLGNDIRESSVPFDIDRKLTESEIEETVKYCKHDVYQTIEVFTKRIDEFNTMLYFIKHFNYPLSDLSKTKAQLASKILGGNYNYKKKKFNDEFQFQILDCIELKKYKFVADWYKNNHDYSKSQKDVMVEGVPHTFSWGGGHGARPKFHAKGDFLLIDVTAYYPSEQKEYKFGYRVMNNPENFEFIHDSNIEFKRKGDKKAPTWAETADPSCGSTPERLRRTPSACPSSPWR